jgi:ABC-type sugar transport system substrate-binding protein
MKKILSIVLTLAMVFSLFACAGGGTTTSPSPSVSTAPSVAPSVAPSPSAEPSPSAAPSPSAEPSPTGVAGHFNGPDWVPDTTPPHGDTGWYTDKVDWFDRDPYKIVFIYSQAFALTDMMGKAFQAWSTRVNYEYTESNANMDNDAFLNNMELFASQGWQGMILQPDATIGMRVKELATELKIAWMPGVSPIMDENNNLLQPMVTLGTKYQADMANNWLFDNYKTYWGDIELNPKTVGYICLTITANPILKIVYDYSNSGFKEKFPEAANNVFDGDCINQTNPVSADAGYNVASAIMAAHPEIEHWFITSVLEDYSQGASRAAGALNIEDKVLICSNGANILIPMLEADSADKSWVAGIYYAQEIFCEPLVCGIIAMLDGRATPETLYPEWKAPGATYANILCDTRVVTKETYKEYLDYIDNYISGKFN